MKKILVLWGILFVSLLSGCGFTVNAPNTEEEIQDLKSVPEIQESELDTNIEQELLAHVQFLPPEVGTSVSMVRDQEMYQNWGEIFQLETIPPVDFTKEEVLFITTYSDGCGLIFERVEKDHDTLMVQLNYPEELKNKSEINCTEIAMPQSFVVKVEKTDASFATLMDAHSILLEQVSIQ